MLARQVAMVVARRKTTLSLQEIGRLFGGRDHGTVMHAMQVIDEAIKHNANLKNKLEYLYKLFP